jgi:hypothetical protein
MDAAAGYAPSIVPGIGSDGHGAAGKGEQAQKGRTHPEGPLRSPEGFADETSTGQRTDYQTRLRRGLRIAGRQEKPACMTAHD